VPSPVANRDDGFSICTSHGFSRQGVDAYVAAGRALAPDIFVGAADLPGGGGAAGTAVSQKRAEKAARRTGEWTARLLASRPARGTGEAAAGFFAPALFAPIPLLPADRLQLDLAELAAADVLPDGLALYDAEVARALPDGLRGLPRLSLAGSATPRAVLAAVAAGADVVVLQLVNAATDAGVALDFSFPAPSRTAEEGSGPAPLGRDMFDPSGALASSLAPLAPGCGCYACTVHHSAYLRHLLHTKEMLGWTLLQVHNHAVAERFFSGIRDAIARGAFEEEREAFERLYVDALPEVAGAPPRIRGYHLKSEGPNEARKNAPAYSTF
jgi:queuine tRNA-ribosyltransferase